MTKHIRLFLKLLHELIITILSFWAKAGFKLLRYLENLPYWNTLTKWV